MLASFDAITKSIRGKYIRLKYAEVSDFQPFARIEKDGKLIKGLSLMPNKDWKKMPFIKTAASGFNITDKQTEQGNLVEITITGSLNVTSTYALETAHKMKKTDLVVKMTLQTQEVWLMSDPDFPATFEYKMSGGGLGTDVQRIDFTIKAQLPYPILQVVS